MKKYFMIGMMCILVLIAIAFFSLPSAWASGPPTQSNPAPSMQAGAQEGCLTCHEGIENIRDPESGMMKEIMQKGQCTTCHGGNPDVTDDKDAAHTGAPAGLPFDEFYPDPGSIWVASKTCGQCHAGYAEALERSLMNTEAGKIQGNLWAWGVAKDQKVIYGNYDVEGSEVSFGTDAYKDYMNKLMQAYPDQFPQSLEQLPNPSVDEIVKDPKLAAFTYQRQQCQRCHVGVKGRAKRADWRGMGCSACHIPYSNEGLYEGNDPTIPKDEPGHLLVHEIQATRESRGGIPVETCVTCHNRGKRIGVSYQGLMEFPYGSPWYADGTKQDGDMRLHTKRYLYIKEDLHHERQSRPENPEGGLLCQDCHTSIEMHGDGSIPGTTLAQVEIECADCHGTPTAYPWELPLGYGEEFSRLDMPTEPRGVGSLLDLPQNLTDGVVHDPQAGYLLTARGNPFGDVVRTADDKVIVHSATGKDFYVPLLKTIAQEGTWKSQDAVVAMEKVSAHMEKMECYACHADWAPQCYGCHVNVQFTVDAEGNALMDTDWVASGNTKKSDGTHDVVKSPGKVKETRTYLRWESPILGVNGEGRVTPLMPGCQVIFTVIGPDGQTLTHNEIARTPPNTEGAGPEGQRGMDMAPVQPHTAGRKARTCESCHSDPKALGYGIEGGRFMLGYDQDRIIDLRGPDGEVIPANAKVQIAAIPDLPMDLSQIVDPETGEQMMTVGSHWPDSGPLSEDQRTRMERTGVCMGCHQNMADATFWNDKVIAKFGQALSDEEHIEAMNQVIQAAVGGEVAMAPQPAPEETPTETPAEATTPEQPAAADVSAIEGKLNAVETKADEALSTAEEAKALATEAGAKAEAAEKAANEAVEALPTTTNMTLYVVLALVLGLLVGGGVAYFAGRKDQAS